MNYERRAFAKLQTPAFTPSAAGGRENRLLQHITLSILRRLPQSRRSKANFASPSLGRGRALMPAPPFSTNLLLRKIFAGTLILPQSRRQHKCWTTRHRLGGARRTPPRSRNGTLHVPFPSSKAVKAPPGLCQESAFSPLNITPKTLRLFLETRRRSQGDDASSAQQMRARQ